MDVEEILESRKAKYKTVEVTKEVELQYDLGNLVANDLNPLDASALKEKGTGRKKERREECRKRRRVGVTKEERDNRREDYLKDLARDNSQLLVNKLWELPTDRDGGFVLAQLPACTTVLPREKPIPKPKPPTKWEQFAKTKGIRNTKRQRMVFDEKAQEWKPRWGYKRTEDPKDDWVLEVPDNADPYEDQFEKRDSKKKENIAKNEYQRLRNIGKNLKGGRVKVPLPPAHTTELKKHEVTQALGMAKKATASVGKFTPSLAKESVPKREKKRRFDPVAGNFAAEKQKNLSILGKLSAKKPALNVTKAVNTHIASEESNSAVASRKRKAGFAASGSAKRTKRSKMGGKANFNKLKSKTLGKHRNRK